MRNSFSLSVYFLLGCKCDVKIVYKISDTASGKMKLIPLIVFISIAVDVKCNEQYTFPPKFHQPNSGIMLSSDSSIYLPPESHTAIPYYPMKNVNNLPFPYLPHTGTKAPVILPTAYPLILSSTLLPLRRDDSEDEDEKQPLPFQRTNRTERNRPENVDRRDFRPKPMNYQPIDRIDMKVPFGFFNNNAPAQNPQQQKATPRSMIISPEQPRNDAFDQFRSAATYQGPHYLPAPNAPGVYISSTTETAVPILRLSNEMDLDGSFSYEALGADQTHYVQHSRMENTGTDKEEQVVEGSYSYVGDNGQTYTVHYVADSKGFRASGDHLPVAPPIPEIIQRAVQFNLAEEAKKPPNQKSWNEEKENELSESEKYHRFAIPPPSRPLFTGQPPESFSFGFAQGVHNTQNNLLSSANTQNPIRTNKDFTQEHTKSINGGTISPQITFLASQGAHVPSANTQQSISRVFTTDRSTLPQLINYEAAVKEDSLTDQSESNKGLWRWQYGLNANMNQTPEKNTISRSSAVGDDVMINFSDMTPDQYTKMIRSQLEPSIETAQNDQIVQPSNVMNVYKEPNHNAKIQNFVHSDSKQTVFSTENNVISTPIPDWQKNQNNNSFEHSYTYQPTENLRTRQNFEETHSSRSKLITQNNFVPQSQLITQSYDYEDSFYEPKRISHSSSTLSPELLSYFNYNNPNNYEGGTQNSVWSNANQIENIQRVSTTETPITTTSTHNIKFNDFIVNGNKNDFKPIRPSQPDIKQDEATTTTTTTTETSIEEIFGNNFFLKNLFKSNKNGQFEGNTIREEYKNNQPKMHTERKPDKAPKFIQMQAKPQNEIRGMPIKPMDMANVMNYISAKNNFESIKIKPRPKHGVNNYNQRSEVRFIPVQHEHENIDDSNDEDENMEHNSSNHRTSYYHPEELRGIIKNYKVLQRNNSAFKNGHDVEQLRRDLSPPPVKMLQSNLPPLGRAGPSMKSYLPPVYV